MVERDRLDTGTEGVRLLRRVGEVLHTLAGVLGNAIELGGQKRQSATSPKGAAVKLLPRKAVNILPAELEQELIAGVTSGPATPMTPADWIEIRRRVETAIAKSAGS